MKTFARSAAAGLVALSAFAGTAQAAALTFPAPNDGVTSLQYGDFTVYSLAMLNYYATEGKTSPPSGDDPYYLPSGSGHLSDFIVVATGANHSNAAFASTDNPFNTSVGGSTTTFWTGTGNEPGNTFAGDNNGTWDISLDTLRGYLGGQNMYFGFNLNEAGGGRSATGAQIDALAWGKVTLVNTATGAEFSFIFDGTNANPLIESQTLFDLPTDNVDWGHIHGEICVAGGGTPQLLHLGACTGADAGGVTIKQNLGADRTAFALTNDELNDLIYSSTYNFMRVELGLADMSNGYEQLFIFGSGNRITPDPVSEPAAIGLLGLGALGIGFARRRKQVA